MSFTDNDTYNGMQAQPKVSAIITEVNNDKSFRDEVQRLSSPTVCPLLPLRGTVLFPGLALPVAIERDSSLRLIKEADKEGFIIAVVCQVAPDAEQPDVNDLGKVGTYAHVLKVIHMPDDSITVILHGIKSFTLGAIVSQEPYYKAVTTPIEPGEAPRRNAEFKALMQSISEITQHMLKIMGESAGELLFSINNIKDRKLLIDFLAMNLPFDVSQKQAMLEENNVMLRGYLLFSCLQQENQLLELRDNIRTRTQMDLSQQQREHFLQQQLRTIQEELGTDVNDIDNLQARFKDLEPRMPEAAKAMFQREIRKLERLNPQAPDYSVQYNYLDEFLTLPWNTYSTDNFDLKHAERRLNRDHYGLEKVKERILEYLAVLSLRGDFKSPILCLYGSPGVGKTSLGKSIATALGRKYARISLGGLHDEAEIRGHRRTYIGAMMGRILNAICKCGTSNPVIVLDEIDKVGADYKGDPQSALLEVLDPEQNERFHDNFIDVDYDLSHVLFIATANNLQTVSQPLLDRMEVIELGSYMLEEKIEIAKRHLVPKQLDANGFDKREVRFTDAAIAAMITGYTHEAGVRQLEKTIAAVLRKLACKKVAGEEFATSIKPGMLHELLGAVKYTPDRYEGNDFYGVVTGLAWTQVGGEILYVESSLAAGKGEKLTLTGNLGDVMKESAVIALQYLRSHAEELGIDIEKFDKYNVHIHVPEGAIPKDGPSAGITMVTSLASSFTHRLVRRGYAMTGEITLRGKVLPVGGIREKILAAKRAGITDIILCRANEKDINEIKPEYLTGLTFHYVDVIADVLKIALLP